MEAFQSLTDPRNGKAKRHYFGEVLFIALAAMVCGMSDALAIHGHEIIDLVASHPEGIRLGQLMESVAKHYGRMATFHTGSAHGLDLDGLLKYLEAGQKVRIVSGVVYPGGTRALSK